jgi:hypothetical protein
VVADLHRIALLVRSGVEGCAGANNAGHHDRGNEQNQKPFHNRLLICYRVWYKYNNIQHWLLIQTLRRPELLQLALFF